MTMFHEKPDSMLLGLDRERFGQVHELDLRDIQLAAPLRSGVRSDGARQHDGGFLGQACRQGKLALSDHRLAHHGLDIPGAVTHHQELDLAAGATSPHPSADEDFLTDIAGNLLDVAGRHFCRLVLGLSLISGMLEAYLIQSRRFKAIGS